MSQNEHDAEERAIVDPVEPAEEDRSQEDATDETIEESFPGSDPPSSWAGRDERR